ncbi:hypothetical protein N825_15185 [Skermanella stibiiresistens SB22]|uniref:Uncharacterized protein n=1 Tax=Skermanella stibiiresistens SB22 TaxID=1385369 RepID=W9GW77_9PROT|nr:hypothetical protein [Skermanella stibiiresistens]EWY38074.1 hypothetical protein N825_15185 [Skermanella stibiiresistens SB22]
MPTPTRFLIAGAFMALASATGALTVAIGTTTSAAAAELNQRTHLEPRFNDKIQMQIAKSWRRQGELQNQDFTRGSQQGCGSQSVGNVFVPKGAQAPREVVTIITGDVINNVGRGGCR